MKPTGTFRELKALVGVEGPPREVVVDHTAIRLLLEAVGDENGPWLNPEVAMAPPYVACGPLTRPRKAIPLPFQRVLAGSAEFELRQPIRLGDKITSVTTLKDIVEREGKSGKMYLLLLETLHRNQAGELVGVVRTTTIGFDPVF